MCDLGIKQIKELENMNFPILFFIDITYDSINIQMIPSPNDLSYWWDVKQHTH